MGTPIDVDFINSLIPSLLVFAEISFSLFMALPSLESFIRKKYAKILTTKGHVSGYEFLAYKIYIDISGLLYYFAISYFVGLCLILFSPFSKPALGIKCETLNIASFVLIMALTLTLCTSFFMSIIFNLRKALRSAKITFLD